MTQKDEQLDAFEQMLESEFSDEDLQMLEDSIEEEIRQDALLKEEMEGEIFVVLNEFAEQAEHYIKEIYDKVKITREIDSTGNRHSNFMHYISDALSAETDPYNLIFSVPRPMIFDGERVLNSHSAYFKDHVPMTAIGGENTLLWDLRVNADNNALIIRFLAEPNVYAPTATVQLDLTDRNITHHFLDPLPQTQSNNSANVQRAVLEFLVRFFSYRETEDDYILDSEDYQELILRKIDTDSNDLVNAIVSINLIMDKYAEIKRREEFKRAYANRGIESW
ncbi:hypothetical protein LOL12_002288 [Acinetobacter baumannii]|nr:hypothetical protein [Acinetobacter baumannii]